MNFWRLFSTQDDQSSLWEAACEQEWKETDCGRRYGWWLCFENRRIADINYLVWDSYGQFWNLYRVYPFHPDFEKVGYDPNRWCEGDISIESRYVDGFRVSGVFMGREDNPPQGWSDIVALRNDNIPRELFDETVRKARTAGSRGA